MKKILEVKDLKTSFFTQEGEVQSVRGISFDVSENEIVGIVGESGSGKSITSKSIMRIIQNPGKIINGQVIFNGEDLLKKSDKEMRKIRGNEISMVFQDSMTSLNPLLTIGKQISEIIMRHQFLNKKEAKEKSIKILELVGIPSPESRFNNYPHELSGGMRQRVCIAMAISSNPKLLIADEPTTALDVTIQAQILRLIRDLSNKTSSSVILITHDLGVVYNTCDRIIVMYGGKIMEQGSVKDIFENPKHPYTKGLLKSIPKVRTNKKERLVPINGTPPNLLNPPKGCPFYDRCEYRFEKCIENQCIESVVNNHKVSCWLV